MATALCRDHTTRRRSPQLPTGRQPEFKVLNCKGIMSRSCWKESNLDGPGYGGSVRKNQATQNSNLRLQGAGRPSSAPTVMSRSCIELFAQATKTDDLRKVAKTTKSWSFGGSSVTSLPCESASCKICLNSDSDDTSFI